MYDSYGTYVNYEYVDNHDYDDDTDDDNDHKKDSYTAAVAPTTQTWPCWATPGQARPQKYFMFSSFCHEMGIR